MTDEKKRKKEPVDLYALRRRKYRSIDLSEIKKKKEQIQGKKDYGVNLHELRKKKQKKPGIAEHDRGIEEKIKPEESYSPKKPAETVDIGQIKKEKSDKIESNKKKEEEGRKEYKPTKVPEAEKPPQAPERSYKNVLADQWDKQATEPEQESIEEILQEEPCANPVLEEKIMQEEAPEEEKQSYQEEPVPEEPTGKYDVEPEKPYEKPKEDKEIYAEKSEKVYEDKKPEPAILEETVEDIPEEEEIPSSDYDKLPVLKLKFKNNNKGFLKWLIENLSEKDLHKGDKKKLPGLMKHLLTQDPAYKQGDLYELNGLENSLKWR